MRRPILLLVSLAIAASGIFVGTVLALDEGARAPEIGLESLDGRPVRMSALRNKVVIVDFWASWCGPCKEEMPVLDRLFKKYKDRGLVVIGISVDREKGNVRDFLRETPVSFPIIHDPDHRVAGRYEPPRMPSSYVIDKRGVVRHVHAGFRSGDASKLEREVQALLR